MNVLEDNEKYSFNHYSKSQLNNIIKVFGKGILSVKADLAKLLIGVITENVQLEVAQQENAFITQNVITSILEIGVFPESIQTQNYNIRTKYDYIDGKQVFRGYEVTNNLNILITNIKSAGEVIDTAVRNGANNIGDLNFLVSNEQRYYYEVLNRAFTDAQNKAIVMANKLGVRLNNIPIRIVELAMGNISPLPAMTFKSVSGTTPIEAGENNIEANIEVVFEYME